MVESLTVYGAISQVLEIVAALMLAPLLTGWVNQWRAWLQNKTAPPLLQPYRLLHKLFHKESVLAEHASPLFRATPYIVFGCMALASSIIPTLSTDLPLSLAADAIALVGLFAVARVFISLAAMDIGTSFGTLGARREMLIGFLADTHIYVNQVDGIREQLTRDPDRYHLPRLVTETFTSIWDWTADDSRIEGYESYPKIDFPIAV